MLKMNKGSIYKGVGVLVGLVAMKPAIVYVKKSKVGRWAPELLGGIAVLTGAAFMSESKTRSFGDGLATLGIVVGLGGLLGKTTIFPAGMAYQPISTEPDPAIQTSASPQSVQNDFTLQMPALNLGETTQA